MTTTETCDAIDVGSIHPVTKASATGAQADQKPEAQKKVIQTKKQDSPEKVIQTNKQESSETLIETDKKLELSEKVIETNKQESMEKIIESNQHESSETVIETDKKLELLEKVSQTDKKLELPGKTIPAESIDKENDKEISNKSSVTDIVGAGPSTETKPGPSTGHSQSCCHLVELQQRIVTKSQGSTFWPQDWRTKLCSCVKCKVSWVFDFHF